VTAFFDESSDGSAHRWASRRPARRARRRAAFGSLIVGGVLMSSGVAVLTPSAAAEVTADREGSAGRTAAIVPTFDLNYNSAEDPRTCDQPEVAPDDPGFCLDLYKKDTSRKKPLVVVIHGGGWIEGAARRGTRFVRVAKDLAKAGYVALIMDYPKASDDPRVVGTPMQEDAVNDAVAWATTKANRLQYGIDQTKIAFIGGSSGGQLSLLAAFNANEAAAGRITMAYSLSGPVDLWEPIRQLQEFEVVPGDPGFEEGTPGFRNIELYLGCDWDGDTAPTCEEAQAKAVSPLYIGDSTCPLVRITRSETEDMVEAEDLVARLLERGCGSAADPRAVASLAGTQHGFGQWPLIGASVIADLDEHMKPAPPPPPPPPRAS